MSQIFRRSVHTKKTFAVAFDVDGVLYRGKTLIPRAPQVLSTLKKRKVPFITLTNGGGVLEAEKAAQFSKMFNVQIDEEQVVLAHTPMRELSARYGDGLVLVSGKPQAKAIASSYGFKNIVTVGELHSQYPVVFSDMAPEPYGPNPEWQKPITAVLVFMDPLAWHRDFQIIIDVLRSPNGVIGGNLANGQPQQVPIFFSGPDMEYVNEHPLPRFGAGVFHTVLADLFEKTTRVPLTNFSHYGKPYKETYDYAERALQKQAHRLGFENIHTIYAVGDNPKSDIKGANQAGGKWRSILVKTGMFTGTDNDSEHPAHVVVDDVGQALDYILRQEKH